jgi:two-component system, cell cycle sensor histidine kinase and response regulator CckA
MSYHSLIHQIFLWILVPITCVLGFVWLQLDGLHLRFVDHLERDIAHEVSRVERELQLVLETTGQLAAMTARDSKLLLAYNDRATDFLYRMGSNIIASNLIDQVTFVDPQGIVLARGHEEFVFNDSLIGQPFFAIAATGKTFSGLAGVNGGVAFVVAQPVWEFGTVFRGVLIMARMIAPQYLGRIGSELGMTIAIDQQVRSSVPPLLQREGNAQFRKQLPFDTIDHAPMTLSISKSYQAELEVFEGARMKIILFTILATTVALGFVYVSLRYLLRPMRRLRTWLQQHQEGNIKVEDLNKNILAGNTTKNELGFIAHWALGTIQNLEIARTELQRMHRDLELLVEERTRELSQKTKQLQEEVREREQAETRVLGLKNHLQSLFDSMRCTLIGVDAAGLITFVNAQAEALSCMSLEALKGSSISELLAAFGVSEQDFLEQTIQGGDQWQMRRYVTRRQNKQMHLDITIYPFHFGSETGLIIRIDDVTRQVEMEQELFKVEKLKSIGLLAGGIAHDFNNFLAAILGNISLALFDERLSENTRKVLMKAEQASASAKELTGQLLTFAKGGEPRKKLTELTRTVCNAANLGVLGDRFSCRFNIPENLWPVEIDQGQIAQVIQNIVLNATQAMQDGAVIDITCANMDSLGEKHLVQLPPGPYVRITIADSGAGMSAEILSRIFDPYFSTKSEGHGLGLAICYSILRKHNGLIAVESSLGVGTTFFIYLPALPGEFVESAGESEGGEVVVRPLRILVMDDDQMIREVVGAMLDLLGHQVLFAQDGAEAIKKFQSAQEAGVPIDLVLMDLVIPGGMGGKEAVREILRIRPEAKVIVSSGYSNDPVLANFRDYGFSAAIPKPYQLKELARIVNEAVAEPNEQSCGERMVVGVG